MSEVEFSVVLAEAKRGTSWACTELWVRHAAAVTGYLRARGCQEPEDVTSEVFLTVFSKLPQFEGEEAGFRGFLFTVAHRRLVDEMRRRARRHGSEEWTEQTDPRIQGSAEEEALAQAGSEWAREVIESLSPDQRDVLMLRIFGDLTVEQVAEALDKRPGAVKALQRRGLTALRKKAVERAYPSGAPERWIEVR